MPVKYACKVNLPECIAFSLEEPGDSLTSASLGWLFDIPYVIRLWQSCDIVQRNFSSQLFQLKLCTTLKAHPHTTQQGPNIMRSEDPKWRIKCRDGSRHKTPSNRIEEKRMGWFWQPGIGLLDQRTGKQKCSQDGRNGRLGRSGDYYATVFMLIKDWGEGKCVCRDR